MSLLIRTPRFAPDATSLELLPRQQHPAAAAGALQPDIGADTRDRPVAASTGMRFPKLNPVARRNIP
jgi:hypothetical protein